MGIFSSTLEETLTDTKAASEAASTVDVTGGPTPVVICGPSGVGKGTLIKKLMDQYPDEFGFSVSHTTRAPRPGEVDGVHYHFVEKAAVLKDVENGLFLEHAEVHGNIYGTSLAAVEAVTAQGKSCILDIDVQGAELVARSPLKACFVFISPPSMEELERRLRGRGTETEEALQRRLANARGEMSKRDGGLFEHKLVNDDLESTLAALLAVLPRRRKSAADPMPVVVCGPSGVGKGTIISKLMAEHGDKFGFSVSHTTRAPRPGEVDGTHYHFTTRAAMEAEVQEGKFLEYADVHGNMYGTSLAAVQKVAAEGKCCILDIDVQGSRLVKKSSLAAKFVFIAPPSMEQLEERLRGRGTETEEAVQKRLKNAIAEVAAKDEFDHVLVNDDLEATYAALKQLVL